MEFSRTIIVVKCYLAIDMGSRLSQTSAMDYWTKLQNYARRNRQIKTLRVRGWTLARIGAKFGISRARVDQILKSGRNN